MKKILIVEDNVEISQLLKIYLESENYLVSQAFDGEQGIDMIDKGGVDLAIVDIMMPKVDGYQLIQTVRKSNKNLPILILSAKSDINDKVFGLNIGADDYITKPFNWLEVIARVKSALRRTDDKKENSVLIYDNLILDLEVWSLTKNQIEINLTATEYKILAILLKNVNKICSKAMIGEKINSDFFVSDENSITVHISHLRDKLGKNSLGKDYIVTVKGLGYKIEKI